MKAIVINTIYHALIYVVSTWFYNKPCFTSYGRSKTKSSFVSRFLRVLQSQKSALVPERIVFKRCTDILYDIPLEGEHLPLRLSHMSTFRLQNFISNSISSLCFIFLWTKRNQLQKYIGKIRDLSILADLKNQ